MRDDIYFYVTRHLHIFYIIYYDRNVYHFMAACTKDQYKEEERMYLHRQATGAKSSGMIEVSVSSVN